MLYSCWTHMVTVGVKGLMYEHTHATSIHTRVKNRPHKNEHSGDWQSFGRSENMKRSQVNKKSHSAATTTTSATKPGDQLYNRHGKIKTRQLIIYGQGRDRITDYFCTYFLVHLRKATCSKYRKGKCV